ncbi:MAG: hypothetical protein IKQ04_05305 [Oscillospiraceae bacterium]|nr:hypothetical protein [Oscillospiraceae bacterium]
MIKLRETLARRLNRTQEVRHKSWPVREMVEQLTALSDAQFGQYAFLHEPLEGKFSAAQKEQYIQAANRCGQETAASWEARLSGGADCSESQPSRLLTKLAGQLGVTVQDETVPIGGGHVLFAQFVEPNRITIFRDCLERLDLLIRDEGLEDLFEGVDFRSVLLAHELFHAVEFAQKDRIYTQTEKVELWRKPFSNKSRILVLSEIAAMAFAKALCRLSFSPYALDVLLMYSYHADAACALYEEIMAAAGLPLTQETGEEPC